MMGFPADWSARASGGLKSVTGGLMYLQMSYTDCVLTLLILIPFRLLCHGERTKQSPASMRHRE